ncbi:head-tail adaptor protein [Phyllobacterium zundukense]|uniref:Head-tail adaptor protein n=1 Tax=Phyllobacterium zundukense TaxID=1867719 RepID=A0A2N9W454_9HYPH|nr:head-tail adaptor protein [Phyllobacterium zundukense]ATU92008.1 head-tail adaptor protein [Phyllobacterium zundukense]PIO46522.1 head-tail adaptor protein [Phyllobacterium zundukense]
MTRPGNFDRVIILERLTKVVQPSGSVKEQWQPLATVRAALIQKSATELLTGFGEEESGTTLFHMHYFAGLTTADRVSYSGTPYDLKEITEIGRRRGLILKATAST